MTLYYLKTIMQLTWEQAREWRADKDFERRML